MQRLSTRQKTSVGEDVEKSEPPLLVGPEHAAATQGHGQRAGPRTTATGAAPEAGGPASVCAPDTHAAGGAGARGRVHARVHGRVLGRRRGSHAALRPRRGQGRAAHAGASRSPNGDSLSQATAQKDLEDVTPGDVSQTQRDRCCAFPLPFPAASHGNGREGCRPLRDVSEETQRVSQPRARPRVTSVLAPGAPPTAAAHGAAGRVC